MAKRRVSGRVYGSDSVHFRKRDSRRKKGVDVSSAPKEGVLLELDECTPDLEAAAAAELDSELDEPPARDVLNARPRHARKDVPTAEFAYYAGASNGFEMPSCSFFERIIGSRKQKGHRWASREGEHG